MVFAPFFVCWILFSSGGWFFVWRARTAERKHAAYRRLMIGSGALFFLQRSDRKLKHWTRVRIG